MSSVVLPGPPAGRIAFHVSLPYGILCSLAWLVSAILQRVTSPNPTGLIHLKPTSECRDFSKAHRIPPSAGGRRHGSPTPRRAHRTGACSRVSTVSPFASPRGSYRPRAECLATTTAPSPQKPAPSRATRHDMGNEAHNVSTKRLVERRYWMLTSMAVGSEPSSLFLVYSRLPNKPMRVVQW